MVFLRSFIIPFTDDSFSFFKSIFDFLLFFIVELCHIFPRLLMSSVRGVCGHIKASWDNHSNCLSCFSRFSLSICSVCKYWTENTWDLANRQRLYCSRRSTMTKRRLAKKKCSQIYLTTTLLKMGSAPVRLFCRG